MEVDFGNLPLFFLFLLPCASTYPSVSPSRLTPFELPVQFLGEELQLHGHGGHIGIKRLPCPDKKGSPEGASQFMQAILTLTLHTCGRPSAMSPTYRRVFRVSKCSPPMPVRRMYAGRREQGPWEAWQVQSDELPNACTKMQGGA